MEEAIVPEHDLPEWLLTRVPAIEARYHDEVSKQYEPEERSRPSAYFVFSFVLNPHLKSLLVRREEHELKRIFDVLEYLAEHGDSPIKDELNVAMEEMDAWRVWRFLGRTMRAWEFQRVSWYPSGGRTNDNNHVDETRYRRRWQEEIAKIGGFDHLTVPNQLSIRYDLVTEFAISGMRAPKPGGKEWLDMGLPWPFQRSAVSA